MALSGAIPVPLAQLGGLQRLDLSGNALTAQVPGLPFRQFLSCAVQGRATDGAKEAEGEGESAGESEGESGSILTNRFACPLPLNAELCTQGPPTCV